MHVHGYCAYSLWVRAAGQGQMPLCQALGAVFRASRHALCSVLSRRNDLCKVCLVDTPNVCECACDMRRCPTFLWHRVMVAGSCWRGYGAHMLVVRRCLPGYPLLALVCVCCARLVIHFTSWFCVVHAGLVTQCSSRLSQRQQQAATAAGLAQQTRFISP